MQAEYPVSVEWVGYELRPETPPGGIDLKQLSPGFNIESALNGLNKSGAPYGVSFKKIGRIANSRLALEASEYARDAGKYDELHTLYFEAYFREGKDIGDLQTVLDIAAGAGLDVEGLKEALEKKVYSPRLDRAREMGAGYQVAGLPTFIINGKHKIVGARPYDNFVKAITS